jgi:hypothetical protein
MSIRNGSDCDSSLDPALAFRHVAGKFNERRRAWVCLAELTKTTSGRSRPQGPDARRAARADLCVLRSRDHGIRKQEKGMKRSLTTACRSFVCIALQIAAIGTAAAQSAGGQALHKTAMLWAHTANAGAAMRRFIEPAEARSLWDDPQIKRIRVGAENAWDFTAPDGVPGFGPLSAEDVRESLDRIRGVSR